MSVYDKNGNILSEIYNARGDSLDYGYDINGDEVFARSFRVMTYNVQWFEKINGQRAMQQSIIDTNDADFIGMQEVSRNGVMPTLGQQVLSAYPNQRLSNHKNYIAFASKIPFSNVVIQDFAVQDPLDLSTYNETRAYMMCDLLINNKTVRWINTHLCVLDDGTYRTAQMMEILALAEQVDYCIITGDFNFNGLSTADSIWVSMYKPFIDAGYNLADCTEERGFTKTFTASATATSLSELTSAPDNIIVSGNIDILEVKFDTTKFEYLDGNPIDHIPVIATLQIN